MFGLCILKGSLGVIVDDYKFEVYECVGNVIFLKFGELIYVYGYVLGLKGGFVDREIKFCIKEFLVMFLKV